MYTYITITTQHPQVYPLYIYPNTPIPIYPDIPIPIYPYIVHTNQLRTPDGMPRGYYCVHIYLYSYYTRCGYPYPSMDT